MRAFSSGPIVLLDDQSDQIVRRVVTAGALAGEDVGTDGYIVAVSDDLVFEQALVDRAELAHAEVAVVDITTAGLASFEGEGRQ